MGLQTTVDKRLTEEPLVHPISVEKVNCSWPGGRTRAEADLCLHKSRINISFFKKKRFFHCKGGVSLLKLSDIVFESSINCSSVQA